jgi:CRISPR-associated endonuclease/helicase Cas3
MGSWGEKMEFFAHTGSSSYPGCEDWQDLACHLRNVASLARDFARAACPENNDLHAAAQLAGLLHDLGKFRTEFQEYLRGVRPKSERTRHKYAGVARAFDAFGRLDISFAIAGHHVGLPSKEEIRQELSGVTARPALPGLWPSAVQCCPELETVSIDPLVSLDQLDFRIRLLFSCLVDADWTDTTDYYDRLSGISVEKTLPLEPEKLFNQLIRYIDELNARVHLAPAIREIRGQILQAAMAAADGSPGLFSMSVPTGGGKTLSSLAFALRHAQIHGLRRIIYVAPYLSIIEQNARTIREALGDDAHRLIFEHHSLSEPIDPNLSEERSDDVQRRAENWSWPIVITTSVQFFESLFSNRPGSCRKIHNLARSVVILDECQTLPVPLIVPTCDMLQSIARKMGATIVLASATQPGWSGSTGLVGGLSDVREMMPASLDLYSRLRRVQVEFPASTTPKWTWTDVAHRMEQSSAALTIVNTKDSAKTLFQILKSRGVIGLFHLSTSMCPAHRLRVIDEVRRRLAEKEECRLVSTQLIQAGVDVDFPIVLREMAPLDDIIQSAGRCNREGKLWEPDGSPGGRVIVFESAEGNRLRDYKAGIAALTEQLAVNPELSIDVPSDLSAYFGRLYNRKDLDKQEIQSLRSKSDFPAVASKYRLIHDQTEALVVANYDEDRPKIDALLGQVVERPSRRILQQLCKYQVNVRRSLSDDLGGSLETKAWGIKVYRGPYDPDLGIAAGDFVV